MQHIQIRNLHPSFLFKMDYSNFDHRGLALECELSVQL